MSIEGGRVGDNASPDGHHLWVSPMLVLFVLPDYPHSKAMKEAPVSKCHSPFRTAVQGSAHNGGSVLMADGQWSQMRLIGSEVSFF